MQAVSRGVLTSLIVVLVAIAVGCSPADSKSDSAGNGQDGGDTSDLAGTSSGGSSSGGVTDTASADTGPEPCVFECKFHQACVDGLCKNKGCKDDKECNPVSGPKTGDKPYYCYKGKCAAFQCGKDEDCPKGDKCNTNTSLCYEPKTGCAIDADCIDSNVCTADTCDTKTGKCLHKNTSGCCNADLECDDKVKCTEDTCNKVSHTCDFKAKGKCCTEDVNCADSSTCTVDTCDKTSGKCVFTKKKDCCEHDGQCDDSVSGTKDSCIKGSCVHAVAPIAGPCSKVSDCYTSTCAKLTCVHKTCSVTDQKGGSGCCQAATDCPITKVCHAAICGSLQCHTKKISGGAVGPHSWASFNDFKVDGWTAVNTNKTATWHHYTNHKVGGAGSLRYGVVGKKTFAGGFPNNGTITSKAFKVPAGAKLKFFVFFDGQPGAGVHLFGIKVVSGSKETDVWSKNADLKGNTGGAWKEATADLSAFAGKSVQLRAWFDVKVAFPKEDGHGLLIDELVVTGTCP